MRACVGDFFYEGPPTDDEMAGLGASEWFLVIAMDGDNVMRVQRCRPAYPYVPRLATADVPGLLEAIAECKAPTKGPA